MKKIILILITATLVILAGCDNDKDANYIGDLQKYKMPDSVTIYFSNMMSYREIADDETPLLFIEDKDGIELFYDLLKNSKKIPGILDVSGSPYVAKIVYGETVEFMDLYLSFPNEYGVKEYEGQYINHNNSHTGYTFQAEDVEAFLQAYRTELYDAFVEYLNVNNRNASGDLQPMVYVNSTLYRISALNTSYDEISDDFIYLGEITSTVSATTPNDELQANDNILGAKVYQYYENIVVLIKEKYCLYERATRNMTGNDAVLNFTVFLELLTANGFEFETPELTQTNSILSVISKLVYIGDEIITIYEYDSVAEMERDASRISPSGTSIGGDQFHPGIKISWGSEPLWVKGNVLIVLYTGENSNIANFLLEHFEHFAGRGYQQPTE